MDVIFHYSLGGKRDRACVRTHTRSTGTTVHSRQGCGMALFEQERVIVKSAHDGHVNRLNVLYIVVISQRESADKKEKVPWSPPPPTG
jgi:hypothetical protein